MHSLTVAIPQEISSEILAQNVFAEVDRSHRHRKLLLWSGGLIASTIIAAISGIVPGFNSPSLRLADSQIEEPLPATVMVAVTLNQPTVTIPKAAISPLTLDIDNNQ